MPEERIGVESYFGLSDFTRNTRIYDATLAQLEKRTAAYGQSVERSTAGADKSWQSSSASAGAFARQQQSMIEDLRKGMYGYSKTTEDTTRKAASSWKQASESIMGQAMRLRSMLYGAQMMFTAFLKPFQQFIAIGTEAVGVQRMQKNFMRMVGTTETYTEALEKMRTATQGTIKDTVLIDSAFRIMNMGMADTAERAAQVARNVTLLAQMAGQVPSPQAAMQVFSLMMSNQSRMRLDAFGLTINEVDARIAHLADTMDATEAEVFSEAVLQLMEERVDALGLSVETAATRIGRMKTEWANMADELKMMVAPEFENFVDVVTQLLGGVGDDMSAIKDGYVIFIGTIRGMMEEFGAAVDMTVHGVIGLKRVLEGNMESAEAHREAMHQAWTDLASGDAAMRAMVQTWMEHNQVVESGTAAISQYGDASSETALDMEKVASAMSSMIGTAQRWDATIEKHAQKLGAIQQDYAGRVEDIMVGHQERLMTIQDDTLKGRVAAYDKAQSQLVNAQRKANASEAQAQEQHQAKMRQSREKYDLDRIQSDASYQYSRVQLLAEGDVLALEELDARHAMEADARDEDFALQQQQAEATFQLQIKYQRMANDEQVALMRDALADQMATIEEGRRQRLQEEEEKLQEELTQAEEARQQKIASEEQAYTASVQQLGEYLEEYARQHNLSFDAVMEIWEDYYGENGDIESAVSDAFIRYGEYAEGFGGSVEEAMKKAAETGEGYSHDIEASVGAVGDTFDDNIQIVRTWSDDVRIAMEEAGRGATGFGLQTVQAMSEAAVKMDDALTRINAVRDALAGMSLGRMGRVQSGSSRFSRYSSGPQQGYQHGGEFIATRPTSFKAGERGEPERVSIQPMSSIGGGGSMSLGWSGGHIPVHGTGQMAGADMSVIGDAIAQGIVLELRNQLLGVRGQRGG